MQCARSMLGVIAGITARVILVSIHDQPRPGEGEGEGVGGARTNLKSLELPASAPACHGIDSLATLMRVSSEVAEVGLRPVPSISLGPRAGGEGVRYRLHTEVESSKSESAGHHGKEDLY